MVARPSSCARARDIHAKADWRRSIEVGDCPRHSASQTWHHAGSRMVAHNGSAHRIDSFGHATRPEVIVLFIWGRVPVVFAALGCARASLRDATGGPQHEAGARRPGQSDGDLHRVSLHRQHRAHGTILPNTDLSRGGVSSTRPRVHHFHSLQVRPVEWSDNQPMAWLIGTHARAKAMPGCANCAGRG